MTDSSSPLPHLVPGEVDRFLSRLSARNGDFFPSRLTDGDGDLLALGGTLFLSAEAGPHLVSGDGDLLFFELDAWARREGDLDRRFDPDLLRRFDPDLDLLPRFDPKSLPLEVERDLVRSREREF